MTLQAIGELPGVFALAALIAAHMQRLSDEQGSNLKTFGYFAQLRKILPNPVPPQRFQPLRRDAELIAHSQANTLLPNIQSENAPRFGCLMRFAQSELPKPGSMIN